MLQADKSHTLIPSRRRILKGLSGVAAAAALSGAGVATEADTAMLSLWSRLGVAAAKERDLSKRLDAAYAKGADLTALEREFQETIDTQAEILNQIAETPAESESGRRIKLKAFASIYAGTDIDHRDLSNYGATDTRIAVSIVNDLLAALEA